MNGYVTAVLLGLLSVPILLVVAVVAAIVNQ